MGFYVPTNRDVKLPKACEQCHFYDGLLCCVMDTYVHDPENKHEECPLMEIPDNHGRLIDADEFLKRAIGTKCFRGDYALMLEELVGESVTIIPADEMI